jgi:uncharacterized membrane protein YeaQ/YmgE (transglycosylase-associated protein family)
MPLNCETAQVSFQLEQDIISGAHEQYSLKLIIAWGLRKRRSHILDRDRIVTILIVIGIFGGLVGGPILSLADYYASPEGRLWTFMIPEFIGFGCLILMVICGKSKQRKKKYQPDGNDNL